MASGIIQLGRFTQDEIHEMVTEYLKSTSLEIEDDAVRFVSRSSGGHPFYAQQLMYYSYEAAASKGKKMISKEDLRGALNTILSTDRGYLDATLARLSSTERRLMSAAADLCLGSADSVVTLSALAKAVNEPLSKVAVYLSRLSSKGFISRVDRGTYQISDPLVAAFLFARRS